MPITSVTANPPRLTELAENPPGEICRYGVAFPFQVAPRFAAVLCCLRNEGHPVGDFENGSDVFLFDDLDRIDPAVAVPIVRNDTYVDTRGQRRISIHYPVVVGFVPLDALREDGTAHPHAGTGFGFSECLDFPLLGKGLELPLSENSNVPMSPSSAMWASTWLLSISNTWYVGVRTRADPCVLSRQCNV